MYRLINAFVSCGVRLPLRHSWRAYGAQRALSCCGVKCGSKFDRSQDDAKLDDKTFKAQVGEDLAEVKKQSKTPTVGEKSVFATSRRFESSVRTLACNGRCEARMGLGG